VVEKTMTTRSQKAGFRVKNAPPRKVFVIKGYKESERLVINAGLFRNQADIDLLLGHDFIFSIPYNNPEAPLTCSFRSVDDFYKSEIRISLILWGKFNMAMWQCSSYTDMIDFERDCITGLKKIMTDTWGFPVIVDFDSSQPLADEMKLSIRIDPPDMHGFNLIPKCEKCTKEEIKASYNTEILRTFSVRDIVKY
jgi:hypothetical protein